MAFSGPSPRLEHVANIHLDLAPAVSGGETPRGKTNWFEILGGTISSVPGASKAMELQVLPGGGDYTTLFAEHGVLSLDIHMVAKDALNGDLFRFQNSGFIHVNNENVGNILLGSKEAKTTEFGEADVFERITCNTSSTEHGWMNFAVMVAQGRLLVSDGKFVGIEFRVFKMLAK
ncbi:hypothetical protein K490DRAFT_62336 [Saccharata proteae CBS 121410]|uniref:Uncharacterized protein n=1 Tax=Saccharata proteae CBS 121410 TaxID=1314787 RepID=A0A9P4I1F6_9PEZI|nr:hypothetical protein K490DRAFT_62336 [Saccharata proteae CBS 121410]